MNVNATVIVNANVNRKVKVRVSVGIVERRDISRLIAPSRGKVEVKVATRTKIATTAARKVTRVKYLFVVSADMNLPTL